MRVIADFAIEPKESNSSHTDCIKECLAILENQHCDTQVHAHGTNIEGELTDILSAVADCHQKLHEGGIPRMTTSLKIESRVDKEPSIEKRVGNFN